ncbi:pPIWI_RE_Z domain-containing protein [Phormidium nigroviride]
MRIKPDFWKGAERICWLCVLMEEFIAMNSLEYVPLVMSGMASILNAPALEKARQAIFNMRLMSLAYVTEQSVKHAVAIYNDRNYRNKTQGTYKINSETLHFERTDPLEDPLITKARKILSQPLAHESYSINFADPRQSMAVALGEETTAARVPIGPISPPLAQRRTHSLERSPKEKIRIPLSELYELAVEMDEREANYPERRTGSWANRFQHFALMVPEIGKGLRVENVIELENIKHLIGLPGSGKTTLLVLIAIWLGRRGYRAMFVFPSIEVARQYMATLAFHEIKVGMLVGQSDGTRRRHADNIAEAIAASGGNGGFAYSLEQAEIFGLNCVLPAFSNADTDLWGFGYAPCQEILQSGGKKGQIKNYLCPVWTMCGRNKAPRDLIDADIWVGHVISMDTEVPPHAIRDRIRYFELIARTFDVVVFDEADMVQSNLDAYGAATLRLSGAADSIHLVIQEQIHNRFARGENYRLFDRTVELYSRDLAEFGNHNTSLVSAVQNLPSSRVSKRYENQLLTVLRIVSDLLDGFEKISRRDRLDEEEVKQGFSKSRALKDFWETAAYHAFYDRTGIEPHDRLNLDLCAQRLRINPDTLKQEWETLIRHFCRYLAENLIERRDNIIKEIAELFLPLCFKNSSISADDQDTITLLVCVTFVILGYQRIVPGTRTMVAEGLIREPIVESTATPELRKVIPENILGSFSGVKYSLKSAQTTRTQARNVELSYITFVGAPRMLMHRFHRLFEAESESTRPAILMTSATSFLEASPAYHVNSGPHYLLKPRQTEHDPKRSVYRFKWLPDREHRDEPLRYSGAGELRDRNLKKMVDVLVQRGTTNSEIYKSIHKFDVREGIYRKAALIVNSYEQAREIKEFINDYHPEIGKRTKAIVRSLKNGEQPTDFVTTAQCEALGDDETCDIIIFPMLAIGRGVNIVFTKGDRKLDAAIGTIYFLTRPHPTTDDMQLLYSLAGKATQQFDSRVFTEAEDLPALSNALKQSRNQLWRTANRLLREPLMASRLGEDLFKPFTANQMVGILQTIGRGMRNGCPVQVYFVDAAWAIKSTQDQPDSGRDSMLVQMRIILEECVKHSDPVIREIYQELYGAFLDPLRRVEGVVYPEDLRNSEDVTDEEDDFDDFSPFLEM